MTIKEIINFEKSIAHAWEKGSIKAPVHLHGSEGHKLEKDLAGFFRLNYTVKDWIFSTHRSHYHWLLSGRSRKKLREQILGGHSMHIFGKKFFTSAIVAGNTPIALGVAMALKMKKSKNRVLCFMGDAAAKCGIAMESINYAAGHNLPIVFIIEDNGKCVKADTQKIWGLGAIKVLTTKFERTYPHAGTGKYVMF